MTNFNNPEHHNAPSARSGAERQAKMRDARKAKGHVRRAMTGAERQAKLRAGRKAKGVIKREYYATVEEHKTLADLLAEIRA